MSSDIYSHLRWIEIERMRLGGDELLTQQITKNDSLAILG